MLITIGVVCGVGVGVLAACVQWRRQRLAHRPGVIRCKLRPIRDGEPRRRWRRRWVYGEWVHDVLVIHQGVFVGGTVAHAVRFPEGVIQWPQDAVTLKRGPATLRLRLDDGSVVELAATDAARPEMAGPFLAVAALDAHQRTGQGQEPRLR